MIYLTAWQSQHYPTIKYFLEDSIGQGKTTILAIAYIQSAVENPGRKYYPVDFPRDDFRSRQNLLDVIIKMCKETGLDIRVFVSDTSFLVNHPNPFISKEMKEAIAKQ